MGKKSQSEITSAENKSIGFDYQYYYFLLQLLRLKAGQKIGLEVKDDIHIELPNNKLILLQLKHTLQTKKSGEYQNLTERDLDFWKTLHNWINIIQDEAEGRKVLKDQLTYISNTSFVFVSNKSSNTRNALFTKIVELNSGSITISDFKKHLKDLFDKTEDTDSNKDLREYIAQLKNLSDKAFKAFVGKIEFRLDEDDIIAKIRAEIASFFIPPERIDDVYTSLNSTLRDNIFFSVKSKKKIVITHADFLNGYRNCFGRMKRLPIRQIDPVLPDDYNAQPFVKQLLDIGDVHHSEKDQIVGYTKLRLLMFNNMKEWIHNGELTGLQKKEFEKICLRHWDNSFRAAHQKNRAKIQKGTDPTTIEEDIVDAANSCLMELRKVILKIEDEELDLEISNGQFYQLADELKIGWHLDWEKKYKS